MYLSAAVIQEGIWTGRTLIAMDYESFDPTLLQKEPRQKQVMFRGFIELMHASMAEIRNFREGTIWLTDMTEMGWKHFDRQLEQDAADFYQDGYPLKMKELGMVDPPWIVRVILAICRLFIKKKLM